LRKTAILITIIVCLTALAGAVHAAPPRQQEQVKCLIVSPADGSQTRGQVVVQGSATHPDFTWYQIGWAPTPNPTGEWTFFHSSESAVDGGQLAVWDTRALADGAYQLLIEVHRKDGNYDLCFSGTIRINNTVPTPTFTAAPLPTAISTPTPLATPEPTATVLVEQPPTATPRATPTYSAIDNPTPTPEETRIKLPIDPNSIRDASCRGAQLTILIAIAIALYFIVRNIAVSGVRKVWKPRDSKSFHVRRPRDH
jgi:hypothetical protein